MMKKSCKDYCPYAKYCYQKGERGLDPDDCPTAWKIEDVLNDYEPEEEENESPLRD